MNLYISLRCYDVIRVGLDQMLHFWTLFYSLMSCLKNGLHSETWKMHCHSGNPIKIQRNIKITSDISSLAALTFWGAIPFGAGFFTS